MSLLLVLLILLLVLVIRSTLIIYCLNPNQDLLQEPLQEPINRSSHVYWGLIVPLFDLLKDTGRFNNESFQLFVHPLTLVVLLLSSRISCGIGLVGAKQGVEMVRATL